MKKVKLFEEKGVTSIKIEVEIHDSGDLSINGLDIGKAPQESFGDSDYEYWLTISKNYKDIILAALVEHCNRNHIEVPPAPQNKDDTLLALIQLIYGGHYSAFSEFRNFLDSINVPSEFSSYS